MRQLLPALALLGLSAAALHVKPYLVVCPQDGAVASATGNSRLVGDHYECEYKHIHFKVVGDGDKETMIDVPHIFWETCTP